MNIQNNRTKIYNCAYLTTQEKSETEIRYRDRFVSCFSVKTVLYQVKKALVKHQAVAQRCRRNLEEIIVLCSNAAASSCGAAVCHERTGLFDNVCSLDLGHR
jgi:hypothetical protein